MRLKKILKRNKEKTKTVSPGETKISLEREPDKNEENMFSPKVAYRVLRGKRAKTATRKAEAKPTSPPAEKPAGRDRILKYMGIVGSLLLFLATLSGIALALVGLMVVIILTIDPDNRYADLLRKINGGKSGKPKDKQKK